MSRPATSGSGGYWRQLRHGRRFSSQKSLRCSLRALVCGFGQETPRVAGALGASAELPRYGIPALTIAGGSEGLHLQKELRDEETDQPRRKQNCTAFPMASLLACSFDSELIRAVGAGIGREMAEYGVELWLAPGANLLRTPRQKGFADCWSEDPVLSGLAAMAIAQGAGKYGAPVLRAVGTHGGELSQRTYRMLYAMPFEIACGAYPAVLLPDQGLNGQPLGEDSALTRSMIVDWRFGGMFLADNERYDAEPSRVALEKSALRIVQLLRRTGR